MSDDRRGRIGKVLSKFFYDSPDIICPDDLCQAWDNLCPWAKDLLVDEINAIIDKPETAEEKPSGEHNMVDGVCKYCGCSEVYIEYRREHGISGCSNRIRATQAEDDVWGMI